MILPQNSKGTKVFPIVTFLIDKTLKWFYRYGAEAQNYLSRVRIHFCKIISLASLQSH
jgi:hypothetical protein